MDAMEISLIVLVYVSAICICTLTVYIVMLIRSAKKLTDGINTAVETVNNELEPVVKDLKETIGGVNSLVKMADSRVKVVNCAINGVLGATGILGGKLKSVLNGLVEGFRAGVKLFKK